MPTALCSQAMNDDDVDDDDDDDDDDYDDDDNSAVVNSPPKGKCGRLRPHLWLRLDAVAVIPCLEQCLKLAALCLFLFFAR